VDNVVNVPITVQNAYQMEVLAEVKKDFVLAVTLDIILMETDTVVNVQICVIMDVIIRIPVCEIFNRFLLA